MEINPIVNRIKEYASRTKELRGYLEYDEKRERLEEVERELEDPAIWNNPENAQKLGRERSALEEVIKSIDELTDGCNDCL